MKKPRSKIEVLTDPEWSTRIAELRTRKFLTQQILGQRLGCSAMAISRWERGVQEPTAEGYIGLGNLAGDPLCWYFWDRAGLRNEDLMRVLPKLKSRLRPTHVLNLEIARAGAGNMLSKLPALVPIPLIKVVAGTHGERGDSAAILHDAPVEKMLAAPNDWCPNPFATLCLRVKGNSMKPLINDGYAVVVDTSQTDHAELDGKIVIAAHRDNGLSVSRLQVYGHTEVLLGENNEHESVVLNTDQQWKVVGKVLWWIGHA